MSARLTTTEFIERARLKHGDKFDYSKVIYVGSKTKVEIVCFDHGHFMQTPLAHLKAKYGCPDCAGKPHMDTAKFINRSISVHGARYGYSNVNYVNAHTPVTINCKVHGMFKQTPDAHVRGCGCLQCGIVSTRLASVMTVDEFILKARRIHGNAYDYSKYIYINYKTPSIITCPSHGDFRMDGKSHISHKYGCPECGKISRIQSQLMSCDEFVRRASLIHNYKYDYSKVVYNGIKRDVEIVCPEHGSFYQSPNAHIHAKSGCYQCGVIKRANSHSMSFDEFSTRSNEKHNGNYTYIEESYTGTSNRCIIVCNRHGEFEQLATNHLYLGHGCPMCSYGGGYSDLKTCLYYIKVADHVNIAYKIGITTKHNVMNRYTGADRSNITVLAERWYDTGRDAFETEQQILKDFYRYKYTGPPLLRSGGNTELFSVDIFGLDKS